ncbi:MAG: hypothetical protein IKM61_00945 [Eubacteriaceae bacterium]|nr:hypothetical protein [Eubacteriaceae bacterium]
MIYEHNDRLKELRYKVYTIDEVREALASAKEKLFPAEENVRILSNLRDKERSDVESYEGGNISSFFHSLVGRKEEKLEKEREEMYDAESRYNMAVYELNNIEINISRKEEELRELLMMTEEYNTLISDKRRMLGSTGRDMGEFILMEENMKILSSRMEYLADLISHTETTLSVTDELLKNMDEAEYWAERCTRGGKNKATWSEIDGRDTATNAVYEIAPKVGEMVGILNEKLVDSGFEGVTEIELDMEMYSFKDPAWELFYGHRSLLWDIQAVNETTRNFRSTVSAILDRAKTELAEKTAEYTDLKMKYEDMVIDA